MQGTEPTRPMTSPYRRSQFHKLSVLMPVFNEARTLRTIIHRVLNAPVDIPLELVAVDDGSTDGSREIITELAAADARIRVVFHEKNQGKGAAIRTAIRAMTGDLALVQDADLEYSPSDYPVLLRPMLDGVADVVFGSRFLCGSHRRVLYFWHSVANHILTLICNVLNDINLSDMETGYKLIRADVLRSIPLTANTFTFEPELTTKLAQWGLRMYEVPISYEGRTYAEGKKIGLRDFFKALWAMFKYRFISPRFTTHEGFYILQSLRRARGFNRWLFRKIMPYIGDSVAEAGCGIGNLTEFLLDRKRLVCVDNDKFYVDRIYQRFGHLANVIVEDVDLMDMADSQILRQAELDTIVCTNVLEHVQDDVKTLRNFYSLLQPGGHAVVLVPAHPWLYSGVDKALGHYLRYTRQDLVNKMQTAGFEVIHTEGFNRLGTAGWFVSGKLLRSKTLSPRQMKLYEWLLPLAKLFERLPLLPHLSIIAIGRKPV